MKIIVDTNIVFSALLNTDSLIASILFNPGTTGYFYSLDFLKLEISNHQDKLIKYSRLTESQLHTARDLIYNRLQFIDADDIASSLWRTAYDLCNDIDADDTPFVALTLHLEGVLWTGDRKLAKGLEQKGFSSITSSTEMVDFMTTL